MTSVTLKEVCSMISKYKLPIAGTTPVKPDRAHLHIPVKSYRAHSHISVKSYRAHSHPSQIITLALILIQPSPTHTSTVLLLDRCIGTANWYLPVYVDQARPKNYGYCAWHYGGKCAGTTVQFAFFWGGLDYDSSCQVGSGGLTTIASGSG